MQVTLKKAHFSRVARLVYGFGWVSNGHFAVALGAVKNRAVFAGEPELVAAALGLDPSNVSQFSNENILQIVRSSKSEPFKVSGLSVDAPGGKLARVIVSGAGVVSSLDHRYCDLLGILPGATVYGPQDGRGAFYPSEDPEARSWVVMPIGTDREKIAAELGSELVRRMAAEFFPQAPAVVAPEPAPEQVDPRRQALEDASGLALGAIAYGSSERAYFFARKAVTHGAALLAAGVN